MKFKLENMLRVGLIALVVFIGCDTSRDMVMDMMSPTETETADMTDLISVDTEIVGDAADMESASVKLVWFINYPTGGKADYLAWVVSVAPTLQAPAEVKRIASYDNIRGENPHRLVEFEFDSFADAATYQNRPEIAAVSEALPNHSSEASIDVFIHRSDYEKAEDSTGTVKLVYLVDYPLGGKADYLAWVVSVAPTLQAPAEVKRIASYDNYNGVTPHRLIEFEFDSLEAANTYLEQAEIQAVTIELPNRASRVDQLLFEQRSDYVNR